MTKQLDMFATDPPKREPKRWVRHPDTWDEVAIEQNEELQKMVKKRLGLEAPR